MTSVDSEPIGSATESPSVRERRAPSSGVGRGVLARLGSFGVIIVATLALVWLVTGVDPATSAHAFLDGSVGDSGAIARTLVRAIPLLLVGLGASLALRGGVVNVGGEGQMAMGAIGAVLVVQHVDSVLPAPLTWLLAMAGGAVAAAAWAVVPAALAAYRGVSEILSTLLLNLITVSLMLWLLQLDLLADPDPNVITPQGAPIDARARLPIIWHGTPLHAGAVVAVMAMVGCIWWRRTPGSMRVDLVGANPNLAAQSGLRPRRIRATLLFASAAMAGIAAAVQLLGVSQRVTTGLTGGIGYTGVLVAVLGGGTVVGTAVAAVGFAALVGGGEVMEFHGVPRSITVLVQALAVVYVTVMSARQRRSR